MERRKVFVAITIANRFRGGDDAEAIPIWSIRLRVVDIAKILLRLVAISGCISKVERIGKVRRSLEPHARAIAATEADAAKASFVDRQVLHVPARSGGPRRIRKGEIAPRVNVFGLKRLVRRYTVIGGTGVEAPIRARPTSRLRTARPKPRGSSTRFDSTPWPAS